MPKLPRVALPSQLGGWHRTRKNELARKAKHRVRPEREEA